MSNIHRGKKMDYQKFGIKKHSTPDPNLSRGIIIGEIADFKIDAIDALGQDYGKKEVRKLVRRIRKMKRNRIQPYIREIRKRLGICKQRQYIVKPRPTRTKVQKKRKIAKMTLSDIGNDALGVDLAPRPATQGDLKAVPDVSVRLDGEIGMYPYDAPFTQAVPDAPVRLDAVEDFGLYPYNPPNEAPQPTGIRDIGLYPYNPSDSSPDPTLGSIEELGTLLPPRAVEKPWKTERQRMFAAGDFVFVRPLRKVGQLRAVRGMQGLVAFEDGTYAKAPIQDMVIYYGTVRKLRKAEKRDAEDLTKLVGYNPGRL